MSKEVSGFRSGINIDAERRRQRGESHRCAKLTEATAQAILDAKPDKGVKGVTNLSIEVAAEHGVTPSLVTSIWLRRRWKHLKRSNFNVGGLAKLECRTLNADG